jgi:hypothetical protein
MNDITSIYNCIRLLASQLVAISVHIHSTINSPFLTTDKTNWYLLESGT